SNLIKEESRRHRYAARALEFARDELDRDTVVRINLDQYDDLLSDDVLKPVVLFLVTEDWYFLSHRLPTANAAAKAGARVIVATSCGKRFREIEAHGFEVIDIPISRFSLSPAKELMTIINVWRVFRSLRPTIVHNVAWKPILYGSIAGRLAGVPKIINNFCGLGMVFTSHEKRFLLLRFVVVTIFRALSKSKQHIMLFQNRDDWAHLAGLGIGQEANYRLVPGSGVDLDKFPIRDSTKKVMNFAIVSRMIRDKGVLECVAAIKWLADQGIQCKLLLVGEPDPKNPQSISQEELQAWSEHSHIEYCGFVNDIKSIWDRAEVALLPSYYGEGVPKCLLEAAASGRPLIATDMPGCRDVVRDGYNGYLVKPRDVADLAAKIRMLLNEPEQIPVMGQASRIHIRENFSSEVVTKIMENIYLEQLGSRKAMEVS
ncbi:MAG: glycosyltransferase family 4 protein, partial [Pseudomonadota bacterium]|nr:glycosyltransferase family 4 protein [Pseudomonadota bacterium]